jgi:hypothetical protein
MRYFAVVCQIGRCVLLRFADFPIELAIAFLTTIFTHSKEEDRAAKQQSACVICLSVGQDRSLVKTQHTTSVC